MKISATDMGFKDHVNIRILHQARQGRFHEHGLWQDPRTLYTMLIYDSCGLLRSGSLCLLGPEDSLLGEDGPRAFPKVLNQGVALKSCVGSTYQHPLIPFETPQIPSNGDHDALNRSTLLGWGGFRVDCLIMQNILNPSRTITVPLSTTFKTETHSSEPFKQNVRAHTICPKEISCPNYSRNTAQNS